MLSILLLTYEEVSRQADALRFIRQRLRPGPQIPFINHDNSCYMSAATTLILFSPVLCAAVQSIDLKSIDLSKRESKDLKERLKYDYANPYQNKIIEILQEEIKDKFIVWSSGLVRSKALPAVAVDKEDAKKCPGGGLSSDAGTILAGVMTYFHYAGVMKNSPDLYELYNGWRKLISYKDGEVDMGGQKFFRSLKPDPLFTQREVSLAEYIRRCDLFSTMKQTVEDEYSTELPITDIWRHDLDSFVFLLDRTGFDEKKLLQVLGPARDPPVVHVQDTADGKWKLTINNQDRKILYACVNQDEMKQTRKLTILHHGSNWKIGVFFRSQTSKMDMDIQSRSDMGPSVLHIPVAGAALHIDNIAWKEEIPLHANTQVANLHTLQIRQMSLFIVPPKQFAAMDPGATQGVDRPPQNKEEYFAKLKEFLAPVRGVRNPDFVIKDGIYTIDLDKEMIYVRTNTDELEYDVFRAETLDLLAHLRLSTDGDGPWVEFYFGTPVRAEIKKRRLRIRQFTERIHTYLAPAAILLEIQYPSANLFKQRIRLPRGPFHLPGTPAGNLYYLVGWTLKKGGHWVMVGGTNEPGSYWLHDDRHEEPVRWNYSCLDLPAVDHWPPGYPIHIVLERVYPPHDFSFP